VSGFYDAGWGRYLADPLPGQGDNTCTLRGYGLGLYWSAPYGFALRGGAAWQDSGPSLTAPDRVPRVYLQLTKSF
jgi:hemolysin activation/secretion protein